MKLRRRKRIAIKRMWRNDWWNRLCREQGWTTLMDDRHGGRRDFVRIYVDGVRTK